MSAAFKQNGATVSMTTTTSFATNAAQQLAVSNMGAIRVINDGNQFADICIADDPVTGATPSTWRMKMLPNSVEVFGPFVGPVYVNVQSTGGAGNVVEFTPGTGGV